MSIMFPYLKPNPNDGQSPHLQNYYPIGSMKDETHAKKPQAEI